MTGPVATDQLTSRQRRTANAEAQRILQESQTTIEIVTAKGDGKHSVLLQIRGTGSFFRVLPVRDPQQPRLWCVAVRQCTSAGFIEPSSLVWIDRPGTSQAELVERLEAIRTDIGTWLSATERHELYRWMMTAKPVPTPAEAAGLSGSPSTRPAR